MRYSHQVQAISLKDFKTVLFTTGATHVQLELEYVLFILARKSQICTNKACLLDSFILLRQAIIAVVVTDWVVLDTIQLIYIDISGRCRNWLSPIHHTNDVI